MRDKPKSKQVSVKIDREHYNLVVLAARNGTRGVSHQLRIIFETFFNGEKP